MNVIVQSKTMVVTQALRDFANRHAEKFLKTGRQVGQVMVFLEMVKKKKNDLHAATAQFLIELPGKNIVVRERAKDMYQAIATAADHAADQLARAKEKQLLRRTKVQPAMVSVE